ncbi:MAG: ABC transporter permease subunit [Phycisphaeraceae bacterium]
MKRRNKTTWYRIRWVQRLLTIIALVLTLVVAQGVVVAGWLAGWPTLLRWMGLSGNVLRITAIFLAGYWVIEWILRGRGSVLGVAHTVYREAMRMKVAVVFVVLEIAAVGGLPFFVGLGQPLQYRVQQFLAYSLGITTLLLALMTIFVSCATLSGEIEQKQIFTVMTKPIHRGKYLFGKWLGIVLLDGLLLAVAGLAIWGMTTFYMTRLPARDAMDRLSLEEQVLTARIAANPQPIEPVQKQIGEEVNKRLERMKEQGDAYMAARGGEDVVRHEIEQQVMTEWRSLGPWGQSDARRDFLFVNMAAAKKYGRSVQLEYNIRASGQTADQQTRLGWLVNGRPYDNPQQVPLNIKQTLVISVEAIGDDGRLVLTAVNLNPGASLSFPAKDGIALMYKVDNFTPNFFRGVMMIWVKLAFLAAMGLAAGTFLGFPVAVLAALLVFVGASGSGFVMDALKYYGKGAGDTPGVLDYLIKVVAYTFTMPLSQFGRYSPTQSLVGGLYISWSAIASCVLWIGVVWTGLTGLIGWMIFRARELARVQV